MKSAPTTNVAGITLKTFEDITDANALGLIAAACMGMFAATASGSIRSPFLPDMAADFAASLPAIANLFGVTSVAWGTSAFLAVAIRPYRSTSLSLGAPLVLAAGMVGVPRLPNIGFSLRA